MDLTTQHATTTEPALADTSPAHDALTAARRCVVLYGALGAAALAGVVTVAGAGHPVNTFMWVRAVLLPLVAVFLHRLAVAASRGDHRAFERLRGFAAVLPVAIVGVDLIPGVCPPWYAVLQAVCVLPVAGVAVLTRRAALRAVFPKVRRKA
jgi:cytochrome bd-type quinol oxidase subunit 2